MGLRARKFVFQYKNITFFNKGAGQIIVFLNRYSRNDPLKDEPIRLHLILSTILSSFLEIQLEESYPKNIENVFGISLAILFFIISGIRMNYNRKIDRVSFRSGRFHANTPTQRFEFVSSIGHVAE